MDSTAAETFQRALFDKYEVLKKVLIPKNQYYSIIEEVKRLTSDPSTKTHQGYYLLAKYEVLQCGDSERLIKKRESPDEQLLYYVHIEETYDIINRAHVATGHGGRDRMLKEITRKYCNITRDSVELFKSLCIHCQRKRKRPTTKGVVVRPILSKDFTSRGQVDLVDMKSLPQGAYKWILVYQDHLTKFCVLRPLTSKRAAEVAYQLMDIFLLFGAPQILQSDNGSEFTAAVISELKELWTGLLLVHGKPRHPQSQGSVERANSDIKDMLCAWMSENKTTDWSVGIRFVQFMKNSSYSASIKQSPYSALFGIEAKVGLSSTSLPHDILHKLQSEDDLLNVVDSPHSADSADLPTSQPAGQPTTDSADLPTSQPTDQPTSDSADQPTSDSTDQPTSDSTDQPTSQPTDQPTSNSADLPNSQNINRKRKLAREAQHQQAERMVKRSKVVMKAGVVGDNVAVPIPSVDRGRGDPRNIIGVIVEVSDSEQYSIACPAGVLNGKYSRNQFDLCPQKLLTLSDIKTDITVSLRSAVGIESQSGGQGFVNKMAAKTELESFGARLVEKFLFNFDKIYKKYSSYNTVEIQVYEKGVSTVVTGMILCTVFIPQFLFSSVIDKLGVMETGGGFGFGFGPFIGGILYDVSKPISDNCFLNYAPENDCSCSLTKILKVPGVVVCLAITTLSFLLVTHYDVAYPIFVTITLNFSSTTAGCILLVYANVYAVCAFVAGIIVDKKGREKEFTVFATISIQIIFAFFIIYSYSIGYVSFVLLTTVICVMSLFVPFLYVPALNIIKSVLRQFLGNGFAGLLYQYLGIIGTAVLFLFIVFILTILFYVTVWRKLKSEEESILLQ
ncbi:KRAB-A domain-containing protein 2 [Nymphon striatum]|nr:KRAB-A domain-containing protein 2 [Nymphon striatum]